jgi:hypothetical protein
MNERKWVCQLLNSHKWVRLETLNEKAYQCSRCGKRHFGKPPDTNYTALSGGGGGPLG